MMPAIHHLSAAHAADSAPSANAMRDFAGVCRSLSFACFVVLPDGCHAAAAKDRAFSPSSGARGAVVCRLPRRLAFTLFIFCFVFRLLKI